MKPSLAYFLILLAILMCNAQIGNAQQQQQRNAQRPAPRLPAFSANPAVADFIAQMAAKHDFAIDELKGQFSKISPNQRVLSLFRPAPVQTGPRRVTGSWRNYRSRHIDRVRIESGVAFWRSNAETLERAYEQFGVPPEIIVAIIGIETIYGRHTGTFSVMESLATLGFHDPRRADFFREELEHFLILSRENAFDPLKVFGSYAGAIGIPQFMPGSWRRFAVDFDGDGIIDLSNNVVDSIGSVANYLVEHGWQRDEPVAHKVTLSGRPRDSWLDAGMLPSLKVSELAKQGVKVVEGSPEIATFINLPTPGQQAEHWLGYQNYYAITRYNRSTFYSMSVVQLANELKLRIN